MKKFLLCLSALLCAAVFAADKPVLLIGQSYSVTPFARYVAIPMGIKTVDARNKWVPPREYHKYSAVYLGVLVKNDKNFILNKPEEIADMRRYVADGGTLIVTSGALYNLCGKGRSLKLVEDILGFSWYASVKSTNYSTIKFTDPAVAKVLGLENGCRWECTSSMAKLTTGKVLAEYQGINGQANMPAILVNTLGKGKVYVLAMDVFGQRRVVKTIGIADAEGRFVLTPGGIKVQAVEKLYSWILDSIAGVEMSSSRKNEKSSWGLKPLGAPGKLPAVSRTGKKPVFKKSQPLRDAFLLAEDGKSKAVIVVPVKARRNITALAKELQRHLQAISGAEFPIVNAAAADKNAIVFSAEFDQLPPETAVVKCRGNQLILGGPGVSLALTYFLEKLGVRYLWPGKLGKIIPQKTTLYAPQIELCQAPVLAVRRIRDNAPAPRNRTLWGMAHCGLTEFARQQEYCQLYRKEMLDMPGNRSLNVWHGLGARSSYSWGHAFGNYYKRFGKTNLEFFALQPNGSRSQEQSVERPRLCLSNPGLVKQIAADAIAAMSKNPKLTSFSICLNDGGSTSFCMCEACRKLDPVNAKAQTMGFSGMGKQNYVSLTDRVLHFSNAVAELVTAKMPDKLLSIYVYSAYQTMPVKVKPHKSLILCLTPMSYVNENSRQNCLEEYMQWQNYGCKLFFRPNALWGHYQILAPQNYARKIFNDLEYYKANGLCGTDYDCHEQQWAFKGLVYYALLKAHWNPDRLSYDEIFDDYCRAGFGKGAETMKKYFLSLEKLCDRAADTGKDYLNFFNLDAAAELNKLLDQAESECAGDADAVKRVQFVRLGLRGGEITVKLDQAKKAKNSKLFRQLQQEMRQFISTTLFESPFFLGPGSMYRNKHF